MSRVVELHHDWMSDPAFRQEFAKLEEESKQLKGLSRGRAGKGSAKQAGACAAAGAAGGDAAASVARNRSA